MRYVIYLGLSGVLFGFGTYVWRAQHSGLIAASSLTSNEPASEVVTTAYQVPVLVEVAGEKIQKGEIDWEYNLMLEGVFEAESMTPIPDLGSRYHDELQTLRKSLTASLVERKMLYSFVKNDKEFDLNDPARFTTCLNAWREAIHSESKIFSSRENKIRLKTRLCEQSVLKQYLKERVFSKIHVTDNEILEYYKNHASEYRIPERVLILQVLLADEPAARKVRNQITQNNFAELAMVHSIAPESETGGLLGPFSKGTMPNVFDVAFHMRRSEISPILKSPYGYHVIMLIERTPGTQASLDKVRDLIRGLLRHKREQDEYLRLVERALATVDVSTPAPLW